MLVAATFAAMAPSLSGGFVFDDHALIENNPMLRGPLHGIWLGSDAPDYWPLTYTLFWLEWRAWGASTLGYHLVSIGLHVVTALLFWRALALLAVPGAWLGALLFAVHPVAVESVAWISEQKNVLSGAFFAGSVIAYLRSRDGDGRMYAISLGLFVAALLSKSSTVMLPVVLLWALLFREGRVGRRDVARTAPFFVVALAAGLVTIWFQWARAMAWSASGRGLGERLGGAGWALWSYLQKAFVPVRLALFYPRWPLPADSIWFYVPLALLLAFFGVLVAYRRGKARPVLFAVGYHAIVLLPVLGLVDIAYLAFTPVSNHLQYLALIGPMALVAAGFASLAEGRARQVGVAAASVVVLAFGLGSASRARAFENDLRLMEAAERDAPQSLVAASRHAEQLGMGGRPADAVRTLLGAAERLRDPAESHRARALALLQLRQADAAVAEAAAARSLRWDPDFDLAIGDVLTRIGRPGLAVEILARVTAAQPRNPACRLALAASLQGAGRIAEATEAYRTACRIGPRLPGACAAYARTLVAEGRGGDVRREIASALGVPIDSPEIDAVLGGGMR